VVKAKLSLPRDWKGDRERRLGRVINLSSSLVHTRVLETKDGGMK
jgi:hypothetical protein